MTPTITVAAADLPVAQPEYWLDREINRRLSYNYPAHPDYNSESGPDPLLALQEAVGMAQPSAFGTPLLNFNGPGYSGVNPPDPIGDVGPNHYVQMINGSSGVLVQIYNKSTGAPIGGQFALDALATSGPCQSGLGDPIVLYDKLADRWLLSEFAAYGNHMCVYVSTGPNPGGFYYFYDFTTPSFPDYPKYAVWPDAYYASTGESNPTAYALNRTRMLSGLSATFQRFSAPTLPGFGFQSLTPADLDGATPPPAGSPGLFMRHRDTEVHGPSGFLSQDILETYAFHVDWIAPANSTFTKLPDILATEFDSTLCGLTSYSCIPQPGTSVRLDPFREVVMWRLAYRNFANHQVLVGNFVTDVNGNDRAGVRWFELRKTGGGEWSLYQEGTYAPGTENRWMGAIAMDGSGNIALGFNVSSSNVYPGLRYAGRLASDALGTLPQGEHTLINGTASNSSNRYGDYSAMSVDPADDCSFWFTGEWNAAGQWTTRIGTFRFDQCDGANATETPPPTSTYTFTPTPTWTATPTPTPTPARTPTWTPTATRTATSTQSPSATSTATKSATPTRTPTATATSTTSPDPGDLNEPDDTCSQASSIPVNGTVQDHTLHDQADSDWVRFQAIAGATYLVEVEVPDGSPADISAELRDACAGLPLASQNYPFAPGIRLQFLATANGPLYLKLLNHDPTVFGPHVTYRLSVRQVSNGPTPGALVIVAGRLYPGDPLQINIHFVTAAVRQLFLGHGYSDERIYYLATDLGLPGVDALATRSNLQAAITQWAVSRVGPDRSLTIYLVDHGDYDQLYLDRPANEWVQPEEIDQWLDQIEAARPGVKVNVIVEACNSGSFIDLLHSVSKPGRVVMTSSSALANAYARTGAGAVFSDFFLNALGQEASLYTSFLVARAAALSLYEDQQPWLDDDGDGLANEPGVDGIEAARRGFAYAGTLGGQEWPPYIAQVQDPPAIVNGQGVIRAEVRDDERVRRVWAVIYPPSYEPPEPGTVLVQPDLPTIVLLPQGNGWYGATYTGFGERGRYRLVVLAEDDDLLEARPVAVRVFTGSRLLVPMIVK